MPYVLTLTRCKESVQRTPRRSDDDALHALWAIIIAVVLAGRLIAAEPVEWKVVSVHDGDTLSPWPNTARIDTYGGPKKGAHDERA